MSANPTRTDTPRWVASILDHRLTWWLARVALTLPFWWSGFDKLFHAPAAIAEIGGLGFSAPIPVYAVLLVVQLAGSSLIIFNRWAWLGAGALAVFTALVTLMVHSFWKFDGPARFAEMNTFMEHMALVAGFVFAAMVAHLRPQSPVVN
jgi:uncharacterized membrane protein YphA (DoxX/SURF4 family)